VEKVNHSDGDAVVVNPKEVALRMRLDYSRGVKDHTTRALEAVCDLCWKLEQPHFTADSFVRDAAELILKLFGIESVAIGVRDPADRLYRYKAVVGLEKESADGYLNLVYTREQLLNSSTYPSHEISSHTRLFLTEEHPYAEGEEFTYRRPGLIGMKRRMVTDSLEADYLDIFFHEPDGEILGFIEISGTRLRKLPDAATIRWIELVGALLGVAFQKKA
jgi:catechol 2,3-dioxygenase-like lactoylglutathione lyase family enzyme